MLRKSLTSKALMKAVTIATISGTAMIIPVAAMAHMQPSETPTETPYVTVTETPTPSCTPTPSVTETPTPTVTPSITPTVTPTETITPTPQIITITNNNTITATVESHVETAPTVQSTPTVQKLPATGAETNILFGLLSLIPAGIKLRRMK